MQPLLSRKQFFKETLRRGISALCQGCGSDLRLDKSATEKKDPVFACLSADFSPGLLCLEAERLGVDPRSVDREDLLKTVYETMQANQRPGDEKSDRTS